MRICQKARRAAQVLKKMSILMPCWPLTRHILITMPCWQLGLHSTGIDSRGLASTVKKRRGSWPASSASVPLVCGQQQLRRWRMSTSS